MFQRLLKPLLLASLLCLVFAQGALAFEDLKFTLGAKYWFAKWDTFVGGQVQNHELKNSEEAILIPSATIRYKNVFLTSSYYDHAGFEFEPARYYFYDTISTGRVTDNTYEVEADRKEFDVAIGYYLIPQLAFTIGYKKIEIGADYTSSWQEIFRQDGAPLSSGITTGTWDDSFDGIFFGANFASAFNRYFAGYGSFAYGVFEEVFTDSADGIRNTDECFYLSSEVGVAFMPVKWVNLTAAYRFQNLSSNAKGRTWMGASPADEGDDRIRGVMVGASVTF